MFEYIAEGAELFEFLHCEFIYRIHLDEPHIESVPGQAAPQLAG